MQIEYTKLGRGKNLVNWGSGYGYSGWKIEGQSGGGHSVHSRNWVWHRGAFGPRGSICCYLLPQAGACSPLFSLYRFLYISYMQGFRVEYLFAGEVGQTQEIISSYFIAKFDLRCELVSWLTDLVCVTLNIRNSGEPILFFILLMSSVCNLSLYKIAAQMYRTGSYFMLKIFVRVRPLHVNHCCLSITSIKTSTPP